MASSITRILSVGSALLGGLLAGMAANKVLVQMPAWGEVGLGPWLNFTRITDQGLGLLLFPIIGASALMMAIGAAVSFHLDHAAPQSGAVPSYAAAISAILALIVTIVFLAPARLSLPTSTDNSTTLPQTFANIVRWWDLKALLHVITFGLSLWALAIILPPSAPPDAIPRSGRS
jgi:hypothetical protein